MSEVALLNPEVESTICLRMMDTLKSKIARLEEGLTTAVLDRENYLLQIGAVKALRAALDQQQQVYDREFKT